MRHGALPSTFPIAGGNFACVSSCGLPRGAVTSFILAADMVSLAMLTPKGRRLYRGQLMIDAARGAHEQDFGGQEQDWRAVYLHR
jgi:hypothetical protein